MIMGKDIVIVGAGGHARIVTEIANLLNYSILGIIDLNYKGQNEEVLGVKVVGGIDKLTDFSNDICIAIAIGDNELRSKYFIELNEKGYNLPALVHPSAIISKTAMVSAASIISAGVVINTQVKIGLGTIVNTGSIVDHETIIGDFVHVAPGVSVAGRVIVGQLTFVGIGSVIIDQLKIGKGVTIGAGSVIIKNIPDNSKVIGVSKLV